MDFQQTLLEISRLRNKADELEKSLDYNRKFRGLNLDDYVIRYPDVSSGRFMHLMSSVELLRDIGFFDIDSTFTYGSMVYSNGLIHNIPFVVDSDILWRQFNHPVLIEFRDDKPTTKLSDLIKDNSICHIDYSVQILDNSLRFRFWLTPILTDVEMEKMSESLLTHYSDEYYENEMPCMKEQKSVHVLQTKDVETFDRLTNLDRIIKQCGYN